MSGQTLLVLIVLCLANVGLSQPVDEVPAPAPTPVTTKPNGVPTTSDITPEEAAGEGAESQG